MAVIVVAGGIIEKDGKYLLIQEAKREFYGKWNLPAGGVDDMEMITDAAVREIKEETGCDVELTGVCQIRNKKFGDNTLLSIAFTTKLLNENIIFDTDEILDVKWFSYEEILAMENEIRSPDFVINAIKNIENNLVAPLEIVQIIK